MSSSVTPLNALQNITGTIVLAGAGKMGGAMLTGWLAGGLDPKRVAVIEPHPSHEISALAAKGVRLNPRRKSSAMSQHWWSRSSRRCSARPGRR